MLYPLLVFVSKILLAHRMPTHLVSNSSSTVELRPRLTIGATKPKIVTVRLFTAKAH